MRQFEQQHAWQRAEEILLPFLAPFCQRFASEDESAALQRQQQGVFLWDAGIRVLVVVLWATLDFLGEDVGESLKPVSRRLDNEPIQGGLAKGMPRLSEALKSLDMATQAREWERFFDNDRFRIASRNIQVVRNNLAHSPLGIDDEGYPENRPCFLMFLLSMSFWAIHPVVTELRIVPWGGKNALEGKLLTSTETYGARETWRWDVRREFPVYPDRLYQVIVDPEDRYDALVVPLFPLMRSELGRGQTIYWLAHFPERDEYRDPLTGNIKRFDDGELSKWWATRTTNS